MSKVRVSPFSEGAENKETDCIAFRIGIKSDEKNVGGINLLGEKFGDYPKDITMTIRYKKVSAALRRLRVVATERIKIISCGFEEKI